MNVFLLLERAKKKLEEGDPCFTDATHTITAILRTQEVIPHKRISINGPLHNMFAGAIVEAYEADTTIDVNTRHAGRYAYYGFSTKIIEYLDKAVEQDLLLSQTEKAKGKLNIGRLLNAYLEDALGWHVNLVEFTVYVTPINAHYYNDLAQFCYL